MYTLYCGVFISNALKVKSLDKGDMLLYIPKPLPI